MRKAWGRATVQLTGGVALPPGVEPKVSVDGALDCIVRVLLRATTSKLSSSGGHFDVEIDVCRGKMVRVATQTEA